MGRDSDVGVWSNLAERLRRGKARFYKLVFAGGAGNSLTLPSLTTAQRGALTPSEGMLVYDSDMVAVYQYVGGAWQAVPVGSATVKHEFETWAAPTIGTGCYVSQSGDYFIVESSVTTSQYVCAETLMYFQIPRYTGSGTLTIVWRAKLVSASQNRHTHFGLRHQAGLSFAAFWHDFSGASAVYKIATGDGTITEVTITGQNWTVEVEMKLVLTAASVTFYIDGASVGSISTHNPTVPLPYEQMQTTLGTSPATTGQAYTKKGSHTAAWT